MKLTFVEWLTVVDNFVCSILILHDYAVWYVPLLTLRDEEDVVQKTNISLMMSLRIVIL